MLILGDVQFELKKNTRDNGVYVFNSGKSKGTLTISFDVSLQDAEFRGEWMRPSICINRHETHVKKICETIGMRFLRI